MNILVIDSDVDSFEVIKDFFNDSEVTYCASFGEAKSLMIEDLDIVFSDLYIEESTIFDITDSINCRIGVISNYATVDVAVNLVSKGIQDYIEKPITTKKLGNFLESLNKTKYQQKEVVADKSHFDRPFKEAKESFEDEYLQYHYKMENGNMTKLAKKVGLDRSNLYRKMDKFLKEVE